MVEVSDIRRRVRSVTNMWQITKAMKMVAASKLRKSRERVAASRPYSQQLQSVMARLVQCQTDAKHPLLAKRPVKKTGYVLVTSDRGLCGGFNANLIRLARRAIEENKDSASVLMTVGSKGSEFFSRRDIEIVSKYNGFGDEPSYENAKLVADDVIARYSSGDLDQVYIIYSRFVSVLTQEPTMVKLLPIEPTEEKMKGQYIFEPSPEEILDKLLPNYIESEIQSALLESKAGEMGSKMMAMDAASDNARKMIADLTMQMNRARQAAITKEISEIVGGAAALE